jgi:hypothetical protein
LSGSDGIKSELLASAFLEKLGISQLIVLIDESPLLRLWPGLRHQTTPESPQKAADLLHRPSRQLWVKTGLPVRRSYVSIR